MLLTDLEPELKKYETRVEEYNVVEGDPLTWRERGCPTTKQIGPRNYMMPVDSLAEAQGITFLCPKCFAEYRDRLPPGIRGQGNIEAAGVGVHSCHVTLAGRGAIDSQGSHNSKGEPSRWEVTGDSVENLTLKPSILVNSSGGCGWHGFIKHGTIK